MLVYLDEVLSICTNCCVSVSSNKPGAMWDVGNRVFSCCEDKFKANATLSYTVSINISRRNVNFFNRHNYTVVNVWLKSANVLGNISKFKYGLRKKRTNRLI